MALFTLPGSSRCRFIFLLETLSWVWAVKLLCPGDLRTLCSHLPHHGRKKKTDFLCESQGKWFSCTNSRVRYMAIWQVHEMYPEIDGPHLNNSEGSVSSQPPCWRPLVCFMILFLWFLGCGSLHADKDNFCIPTVHWKNTIPWSHV